MTGVPSWLIPTVAVIAVLAFAIVSSRETSSADGGAGSVPLGGTAPDISSLSADERVDRLFNRVMAAAEAGKMDSVAFFAPMAVNSFQDLAPLTPHRRFDLGLILLVSGDPALARAQADTILVANPAHLLGLTLAMRAAMATNDESARKRFAARFTERLSAERARKLPEYTDHATEIDAAIAEIAERAKRPAVAAPKG